MGPWGPKMSVFGPKTLYSIYTEYIVSKLNLYFCKKTRSDLNFNQKFDYNFGIQDLSEKEELLLLRVMDYDFDVDILQYVCFYRVFQLI